MASQIGGPPWGDLLAGVIGDQLHVVDALIAPILGAADVSINIQHMYMRPLSEHYDKL